jgi:TPR repeat protein
MNIRTCITAALLLLILSTPALSEARSQRCYGPYNDPDLLEHATAIEPGESKWAVDGRLAAQYFLGRKYEKGICTKQDATKALYWYRRAASSGNSSAQFALGRIYFFGEKPFKRDYRNAYHWLTKAANSADKRTSFGPFGLLGVMHENGFHVAKNNVEALKWYILATRRFEGADKNLPIFRHVRQLRARMSKEEVILAEKNAAAWRPKTR